MDPLDLYQASIDTVSHALLTMDDDLYLSKLALPYAITTHGGSFVVTEEHEIRTIFVTLSDSLRRMGVTSYVRSAHRADYIRPDVIEGLHYTHMLRDGERIAPPHAACQRLMRIGGEWRFVAAFYAVENADLPIAFPLTGAGRETPPLLLPVSG